MNFFQSIIIGLVQGVGEFLPISSSGHLVLVYQMFHITQDTILLSIFLHIATLFSIMYCYRSQLIQLIKHPLCKTNQLLVVATIPTVIVAFILKSFITASFESNFVIFGFLITAVLLAIADYLSESRGLKTINVNNMSKTTFITKSNGEVMCRNNLTSPDITCIDISYKQAIIIGLTQGLACFPGISRSGSTISAGLMLNGDKESVTTFSFLLSIPVILGSLLFAILDLSSGVNINTFSLVTSCLVSFLVGIVSIGLINTVVKKQKLSYFSYYLIGLSFIILAIKFLG